MPFQIGSGHGRGSIRACVYDMDVNTGRLSGLKYKFVCYFKLAVDMDRVFVIN